MTIPSIIIMYVLLIPTATLYIYLRNKGTGKDNASVTTKGLCTTIVLGAAVVALIGAPESATVYAALIVAGIAMGLAGDIALCNNFVSGMMFFAIGHLCYIPAFVMLSAAPIWVLPVFVVLYIAMFALARAGGAKPGAMLVPAIVYSAILTAFLSVAVSVAIGAPEAPISWIVLFGAVMFAVSDALIAVRLFKIGERRMRRTIGNRKSGVGTYMYFAAQSLFAVSVFLA